MAKKMPVSVNETPLATEAPVNANAPMPLPPAPEKKPVVAPRILLTFLMYCSVRDIPVRHRAGMKAFTKLHKATVEEWDAAFKGY